MRGHDTCFPNCRETGIMSPYSSASLCRFVDAAGGGIGGLWDKRRLEGRLAKRFYGVSGGLAICAPQIA